MNSGIVNGLPRFIRDLLGSCPPAGGGVHSWLFRCARALHFYYRDKSELGELLAAAAAGCGRSVDAREIWQAIDNSQSCAWQPGSSYRPSQRIRRWPSRNPEQIEAVTSAPHAPGLVDLWEMSPVRFDTDEPQTETVIDTLFPKDALLCCARIKERPKNLPREAWRGRLAKLQHIVPSPLSAPEGRRKSDGKLSPRTESNVGTRRFLVCDFDRGTTDDHAAILLHLAARAPLALVVFSGNKSLHGWFYCHGQPEERVRRFMSLAVTLGADPALWTRSQLARMPDGVREGGNRQTVYFFNPGVIQ